MVSKKESPLDYFEFGDDFVAGFMLSFRDVFLDVWDFNSSF